MKKTESKKVVIQKRGLVTVPKSFRDILGLEARDELSAYIDEHGRIVLEPMVSIPKDQAWFYTEQWQRDEDEAQDDIDHNQVRTFTDADDAIRYLHGDDGEETE